MVDRARILVIDDEEGIRAGCRRALTREGHEVEVAASMQAGLQKALTGQFDLVLLDVMMPDGSGIELLEPLSAHDPDLVCIIITGFATVELAVQAIKRGAYDFISKPFTSDTLVLAVNQGLERRRLSLEAKRLQQVEAEAEELARAKADMEKLDEIKSQFMLKVAHELRAPVAAIQSYLNLILAGYIDEEEMQSTLLRTQKRLEELLELIADLLDLARLKQARDLVTTEGSPQPAADVLEEVCDLLREQAQQKKQTFEVQILDRPDIVVKKDYLRQIWTNLISNAIKYTPEGGHIAVSLRTDNGSLVGMVEDSGIGIAEADLPHLFQEFFRSNQAKASGEIGTGLGLSIVKQIIDSHHGQIRVRSKLGEGTRFTFSLPLDPSSVKTEADPSTADTIH